MTDKSITPKPSFRRAVENAAGPVALSNRVLLQFVPLSIALVLISNPNRLDGTPFEWLALAIIGSVATLAVLLAFRAIWLPADTQRPPRVLLTVIALLVAGVVRGLSIYFVGAQFGIMPESEFWYRLYGGPLYVLGSVSLLAIFNASRLRHEEVIGDLEVEKAELDELRGGIRERIRLQQADLLEKVRNVLAPVVLELNKEMESSSESISMKLREVVETVVRPLSHDVGSTSGRSEPQKNRKPGANSENLKRRIPSKISVGNFFIPVLNVIGTGSLALAATAINFPNGYVLASIITLVAVWFGYELARRALAALWLPVIAALIICLVIAVAVAFITILALELFDFRVSMTLINQFVLTQVIIVLISFYMQFLRTQRREAEVEMNQVVSDLSVLNSQLRQEVWLNRRRIASILHGSVQAALYASAIKLAKNPQPSATEIKSAQDDIAHAISRLESSESGESFTSVLDQIREVWDGVVSVQLPKLDTGVNKRLAASEAASACASEVVREAVSNAVRHGKAKNIKIEVEESGASLLAITVTNDGLPLQKKLVAGFGSSILDEVAYSWSLETSPKATVLHAEIAI